MVHRDPFVRVDPRRSLRYALRVTTRKVPSVSDSERRRTLCTAGRATTRRFSAHAVEGLARHQELQVGHAHRQVARRLATSSPPDRATGLPVRRQRRGSSLERVRCRVARGTRRSRPAFDVACYRSRARLAAAYRPCSTQIPRDRVDYALCREGAEHPIDARSVLPVPEPEAAVSDEVLREVLRYRGMRVLLPDGRVQLQLQRRGARTPGSITRCQRWR